MKAVEFQSTLNADQTLTVPSDIADAIPQGQALRVLILMADNDADRAWEQVAALDFAAGYAESDAIYDQLPGR